MMNVSSLGRASASAAGNGGMIAPTLVDRFWEL
jgi:hypothetical protein